MNMRIRREVKLKEDAGVPKRSESLLGDYLLDIVPGSESAPLLEDGGEIKKVIDTQGMEMVFNSLGKITGDIEAVTKSLRESLTGEGGEGSMGKIGQNLVKGSAAVDEKIRESTTKLDLIL